MKPTPLYEFMPYGAPELIDARRPHMSRALAVTSAAAILFYGALMAILPLIPTKPEIIAVDPPTDTHDAINEPRTETMKPPSAPEVFKPLVNPIDAQPVPVPDELAKPESQSTELPGTLSDPGPTTAPLPSSGIESTGEEALPGPNTPVYVEQLPAVVHQVKPLYPPLAVDARIEGLVMVRVMVGKDGRVLDALVEEKFSVPILNAAALTAARQWVFTPGLSGERPVVCWVSIPFRFALH